MNDLRVLAELRKNIKQKNPLIHCITNPISIKNCANTVLAVGASPMMAEHPLEVEGITRRSGALALNLGNLTDARMESMQISARMATELAIPIVLDLVGVSVSELRLSLAKRLISEASVTVIKGNMSEIKAMLGIASEARGVDVGKQDRVEEANLDEGLALVQALSKQTGAIVLASGKYDLLAHGDRRFVVKNGTELLPQITGTGCMLTALIASYLAASPEIDAALLACLMMGVAGEMAERCPSGQGRLGTMSFEMCLIDRIYLMEDADLERFANWERRGK